MNEIMRRIGYGTGMIQMGKDRFVTLCSHVNSSMLLSGSRICAGGKERRKREKEISKAQSKVNWARVRWRTQHIRNRNIHRLNNWLTWNVNICLESSTLRHDAEWNVSYETSMDLEFGWQKRTGISITISNVVALLSILDAVVFLRISNVLRLIWKESASHFPRMAWIQNQSGTECVTHAHITHQKPR